MSRNFGLDKLFNKVHRRQSDTSIDPLSPSIIINDEDGQNIRTLRNRARSLSLISNSSHNSSNSKKSKSPMDTRSRSKSLNKKQAKELIKLETNQVILKKLQSLLTELGLQKPVPLKVGQSNSSNLSKNIKMYVANSNNCIYLGPSSSGSFTYEDFENGGVADDFEDPPGTTTGNQPGVDDEDEDEDEDDEDDDDEEEEDDDEGIHEAENHDLENRNTEIGGKTPTPKINKFQGFENYYGDIENMPQILKDKLKKFRSPNYLSGNIDADTPIPHTFGLIIELNKDISINNLVIEFSSLTNILWPSGDPYNKTFLREKFKIGSIDWVKNLNNADFYLNNLNSHDFKFKKIDPNDLAKRTRFYKLFKTNKLSEAHDYDDDLVNPDENNNDVDDGEELSLSPHESSLTNGLQTPKHLNNNINGNEIYKAGIYIFLLPILLPENIPQTITSINGSLNHLLNVSIHKNSDKLNRKLKLKANYNLPMVRTPPSFANSIADKPIYVNRVWNDSLHYIITFPRKYISLGSEHAINVKIVPLVKDVVIKRIKFNVLERITYVSKNLSKEYDYDGEDPYYLRPLVSKDKQRERVISICELKTKNKPSSNYIEPYKEEIIKCPNNNLLFSCYEPDNDKFDDDIENFKLNNTIKDREILKDKNKRETNNTQNSNNKEDNNSDLMIASPLEVNIALPFLTTRNDKIIQTDTEEELKRLSRSNPTSRKASIMSTSISETGNNNTINFPPSSPIIGALETNLTHNHNELLSVEDDHDFVTPDSSALMHEISHNHLKENIQHGFTTIGRALYPDSNYRHIRIHHRLQVCFRISKPDPKDNFKMHHYEVVVDTPLILLSSKCNEESIQLPKYDDLNVTNTSTVDLNPVTSNSGSSISFRTPNFHNSKPNSSNGIRRENGEVTGNGFSIRPWNEDTTDTLPSFEEATSPILSPITRSFSVADDAISRIPSISHELYPDPPAYEQSTSINNKLGNDDGNYDEVNPLNIDAIVNDRDSNKSESPSTRRTSRLRSSLVNSFAPTPISNTSSLTIPSNSNLNSNLSVSPTNTSGISESIIKNANEDSSSLLDSNIVDSCSSSNDDNSNASLDRKITPDPIDNNEIINSKNVNDNDIVNPIINNIANIDRNDESLVSLDSGINSGIPDTSSTGITTDEDIGKVDNYNNKLSRENDNIDDTLTSESTATTPFPNTGTVIPGLGVEFTNSSGKEQDAGQTNDGPHGNDIETKVKADDEEGEEEEDEEEEDEEEEDEVGHDEIKEFCGVSNNKLSDRLNKLTNLANDSESNISIVTQGSFDQRLPLLRNTSTESNLPLSKYIDTPNRFSSENVITGNKPRQDIYHAY